MSKANEKKFDQLGMAHGTATARLKKTLLWNYIVSAGDNVCHQCGKEILSEGDLSIEHKTPWLDSDDPIKLFFDLDNVAYSHLSCNIAQARKPSKVYDTAKERKAVQWARYWEKMGKDKQQERRRNNYKKYGC